MSKSHDSKAETSGVSSPPNGHVINRDCPWCEGSGWLCDGCNRPEVLCMASECRGAALSMSGCPHCVIATLRGEVERLREALRLVADGHIAPSDLARLALDSPHGIGSAA